MKKISICIVTHNNEDNILPVLDSIYKYSKDFFFDTFVVDSKSNDNTVNLIKTNFPQVNIIALNENKGFGYGHNQVLEKINSDYHVILNPDITFNINIFDILSDYLESNKDVAMVTPKILNDDGSIQYLPKCEPKFKYLMSGRLERFGGIFKKWRDEYTFKNKTISEPIEIDFCSGCFIMIRTNVFKELNGFDDQFFMYFEDVDLTKRAKAYGKTVFLPYVSAIHSWERSSSSHFKYLCIHVSSMIKYFYKWH